MKLRTLRFLALLVVSLFIWLAAYGHALYGFLCLFGFSAAIPTLLRGQALGTTAAVIKGDNTILWGARNGTTITGIIVSVRDQITGEMVEIPDDIGFTVSVVFFNDKHECEAELIVQTSYPSIARGDMVTIMGITNVMVTEVEKMWENKQARKLRVKGTAFSAITS